MEDQHPPVILVRTWYDLLMQTENPEAKQRAAKMLIGAFGDIRSAVDYLKVNKLLPITDKT